MDLRDAYPFRVRQRAVEEERGRGLIDSEQHAKHAATRQPQRGLMDSHQPQTVKPHGVFFIFILFFRFIKNIY